MICVSMHNRAISDMRCDLHKSAFVDDTSMIEIEKSDGSELIVDTPVSSQMYSLGITITASGSPFPNELV
jgi:hypothetical protein